MQNFELLHSFKLYFIQVVFHILRKHVTARFCKILDLQIGRKETRGRNQEEITPFTFLI